MGPSIWQLLIIAVIVALIFGTKRLRNVGGDLGAAIKSFKKGLNDEEPNTTTPADAKTKNAVDATSSTTSTTKSSPDKTLEQVNDQTVSQSNASSDQTVQKDSENRQN